MGAILNENAGLNICIKMHEEFPLTFRISNTLENICIEMVLVS